VRQTDRQAGRQAGRQTNKQTSRQADKQTSRQADKQTSRQTSKQHPSTPFAHPLHPRNQDSVYETMSNEFATWPSVIRKIIYIIGTIGFAVIIILILV
jgi:hypothetical protein